MFADSRYMPTLLQSTLKLTIELLQLENHKKTSIKMPDKRIANSE